MENSAQTLTKHFTICGTCSGLGVSPEVLTKDHTVCSACQGAGLILALPEEDLALGLPLYVDFGGRRRIRLVRSTLFLLLLGFLLGMPYLLIISLINFWQGLKGGL